MTTVPMLVHFDQKKEYHLETNFLDHVNGGVLSQKDEEGRLWLITYFSKNLNPAECNYQIYDKELLAIIKCLEEW